MRDIKRNRAPNRGQAPPPEELPVEAKKLYEKHAPQTKPRFTGSKVDVARVHVPRQSLKTNKPLKKPRPESAMPPTKPMAPTRPLFAQPKAEASSKKSKQPKMRVGHKERKVVAVLLGLIIIAMGLAAAIFLPQASIKLILETAPLLLDEQLTLRSADNAAANAVPGTSFEREVRIEGVAPVLSTEIIGSKATGTVQIVNETSQEQPIVGQSRLITSDGVLFYMQNDAIVPPNTRVSAPVEAAEPGTTGNVSSGRLNFAALDSSSQSILYAEVVQPITGGSGEEVKVIKEEDIAGAREAAGVAARQRVEEEIRGELPQGWTILEESWNTTLADFQTEAEAGERLDTIPYTAQILVQVMGYEEKKLEDRLKTALESRLDKDYMLFPGPISFTKSVESIDWENGEGNLMVRVTHTTVPTFSMETLRDKIAGRSEEEAISYLNALPGVSSVSVDLSPFWVRSIPRIDKRVFIDVVSDRQP